MSFATLILAAGAGTRMKSTRAKVVHELLGKPLIRWVVDAARAAGSAETVVVVGHGREQVIPLVETDTTVVVQDEQGGTGHALMIARDALGWGATARGATAPDAPATAPTVLAPAPDASATAPTASPAAAHRTPSAPTSLVVLCGDVPLITPQTITALVASQQEGAAAVSMLTHLLDDPTNYGRVIRDEAGNVTRIIEEKDATAAERAVRECNSAAYCFDLPVLLACLDKLDNNNAQREYYLTDVVCICAAEGRAVKAHTVDAEEIQGINSRAQLARATKSAQDRINLAHMAAGVTMLDPGLVWIGPDVTLGSDVELLPLTLLFGRTSVGAGTTLGPNTRVNDSTIGCDCIIDESVLAEVVLEDGVSCGPRAYLRPGTVMRAGSKAGTHVEIKNSQVGVGSKVPHLSYLGDALLGEGVNIGAGTITCNFDGATKSPTVIGDYAFIGSDTMLVAPVKLGANVTTGAGSVITSDVPDGALAVERAKQMVIEDWAQRHKKEKPQ